MDMKPEGAAEADLVRLSPLLISTYARWFGSPYVDWPGLSQSRRQILLLVYRVCAPKHVEDTLPDEMNETLWVYEILNPSLSILIPPKFRENRIRRNGSGYSAQYVPSDSPRPAPARQERSMGWMPHPEHIWEDERVF